MKVGVIGFGRFGQLLCDLLKPDFDVAVFDVNPDRLEAAKQAGFSTFALEEAGNFDYVYLCAPISQIESVTKAIAPYVTTSTTVIDVCSVKVHPAKVMQANLAHANLLATHPLFGPDSAGETVKGQTAVLCSLNTPPETINVWRKFWENRGVTVYEMTPDEHDRQAAYSQGVAHFIGRALGKMDIKVDKVTTQGFLDLVDLAKQTNNDTDTLFKDLQHYNPYTKSMRDDLVASFDEIKSKLDSMIR